MLRFYCLLIKYMAGKLKSNANDTRLLLSQYLPLLKKAYPSAKTALNHKTPLEMLIATILSAQCTDARVNMVTEKLFKKYKSCKDYLAVSDKELQNDIRSTGFFRNKAKNIKGACRVILNRFNGKVPSTMEDLLTLPGVARKTANVVLGNVFGVTAGIVVDTHVIRLSHRLGLTSERSPEKIERDLMAIVPKKDWMTISYLLINHGRKICKARKPACKDCLLNKICPSAFKL